MLSEWRPRMPRSFRFVLLFLSAIHRISFSHPRKKASLTAWMPYFDNLLPERIRAFQ